MNQRLLVNVATGALLAYLAFVSAAAAGANATSAAGSSKAKTARTTAAWPGQSAAMHGKKSRFPSGSMPPSARGYYAIKWGVDEMSAKLTESGQLVRFTYRVIDPKKAAQLQDRSAAPSMLDGRTHAALQVPTMEKVGPLRQAMGAEAGKAYWIAFSNKGFPVKQGDEVSVTIGTFRADGLIVQ
jgi:hypothetical protein